LSFRQRHVPLIGITRPRPCPSDESYSSATGLRISAQLCVTPAVSSYRVAPLFVSTERPLRRSASNQSRGGQASGMKQGCAN